MKLTTIILTLVPILLASPIDERVEALLNKMNLEEKVAQTQHVWFTEKPDDIIAKYNNTGVGAVYSFSIGGERDRIQRAIMNLSRLHIPVSFVAEALHGAGTNCTIFPMPIGMSATWNPSLIQEVHRAIALEARATGADRTFSPNMNLYVDPRFGRIQEGFGEDPFLQSEFSVAAVNGLQGQIQNDYLDQDHIIATAKHFVAYGHNQAGQDGSATDISERTFREIYLYAWKKVIKADARSIMVAHQEFNGIPCHSNSYLIQDILRNELNWTGVCQSDAGDIGGLKSFGIVNSVEDAAALALNAGVDIDLTAWAYANLISAVKDGKVAMKTLDNAVRRILRAKFQAGIFDSPMTDPSKKKYINSPEHRALARKVAQQSIVLLKNSKNILPLKTTIKNIAVIGPNADNVDNQLGGYTMGGASVVTVLNALSKQFSVKYNVGCSIEKRDQRNITAAASIAKESEVAIVIVGDSLDSCGESAGGGPGDRANLDLSGAQMDLIRAVIGTGTPTIVVMINGRPATFGLDNELLDHIDTLLVAWRPGEEGGNAIVDVLFGNVNPSGKLSTTWPRSAGQIRGPSHPYYQKRRQYDGRVYTFEPSSPLFPFGYGLSYTTFQYSNMVITPSKIGTNVTGVITVSLSVKNTGKVGGREVVQIYVSDPIPSGVVRYKKMMKGFGDILLDPGQTGSVKINISVQDLMYHDVNMKFKVNPGIYGVEAATNSEDKNSLHGQFEIVA